MELNIPRAVVEGEIGTKKLRIINQMARFEGKC
jgi:hypothetical protein